MKTEFAKETRRLIAAVGYCRMSTEDQEASIPKQREEIERYAAANGYKIIKWYIDEAQRGDSENREQFAAMVRDAETIRSFEAIIVWNQKRFSRMKFLKVAKYFDILDEQEIKLISVREGLISFDEIGSMLTTVIRSHEAHNFSVDLGAEICTAAIKTASKGHNAGGRPPYGYVSVPATEDQRGPRKLAVDETKAPIVRQIFDLYVNHGKPFRVIAALLNKSGAASPARNRRDEPWSWQNVKLVLQNEKYTGAMVHGKETNGKYFRRSGEIAERVPAREKGKRRTIDRSRWLIVPDAHAAIISQELFTQAQTIMVERKQLCRRVSTVSPLSGFCRCGHCEGRMALARKSSDAVYAALRCDNSRRMTQPKPECRCYIPAGDMLRRVLEKIELDFLNDGMLDKVQAEISAYLLEQRENTGSNRRRIEKELSQVDGRLLKAENRLLDDMPEGVLQSLYRQVEQLQQRRQQLTAELTASAGLFSVSEKVVADQGRLLINRLKEIRKMLHSQEAEIVRAGIEQIVNSITVWTRKIVIRKPGQGFNARRELDRYTISYKNLISISEGIARDTFLNTYLACLGQVKCLAGIGGCKVP